MAVKIRLKRMGKIRAPYYRIVVADSRTKRDGRVIEEIGKYHPTEQPSFIEVDSERAQYWLSVGAQPTEQVAAILKLTGDWGKFKGDKDAKTRDEDDGRTLKGGPPPKGAAKGKSAPGKPTAAIEFTPAPEVVKQPSEWRIRREALEKEFLAVEGGLDHEDRVRLWPELAAANAGEGSEGQKSEAAVCWLNALWDTEPMPLEWLAGWVRSEMPGSSLAVKAEELLTRLSGRDQARLLSHLAREERRRLAQALSPDDAADCLQAVPGPLREEEPP